jgi:hypothetical protein
MAVDVAVVDQAGERGHQRVGAVALHDLDLRVAGQLAVPLVGRQRRVAVRLAAAAPRREIAALDQVVDVAERAVALGHDHVVQ